MSICSGNESTTGYGLVGKLTRASLNNVTNKQSNNIAGGTNATTGLTAAQRAAIQKQINELLILVQKLILQLKALKGFNSADI